MSKIAKASTQIRIDEELFLHIKEIAEREFRSMNSQIEYFLMKGVERYEEEEAAKHKSKT